MNADRYLTPYTKINSKWIKDLHSENLCDLGLGDGFLDIAPNVQATKEKTDELDFITVKNFCASKNNKKMKKRPTEWKQISASHISEKDLVFRIHKDLQLNNKNIDGTYVFFFGHTAPSMQDLSSPARDRTHAACSGSVES